MFPRGGKTHSLTQAPLTKQRHQKQNHDDAVGIFLLVEVQQQAEQHDLHKLWSSKGAGQWARETGTLQAQEGWAGARQPKPWALIAERELGHPAFPKLLRRRRDC